MPQRKKIASTARSLASERGSSLDGDHRTRRALWVLRLLSRITPAARLKAVLEKEDVLGELGVVAADLRRGRSSKREPSGDALRAWVERRLSRLEQAALESDSTDDNARWLAERLRLSNAQREVLAFAAAAEASGALYDCLEHFSRLAPSRAVQLLAWVIGVPAEDVRASLAPRSPLMSAGLLRFRPGFDISRDTWIGLEPPFDGLLCAHYERPDQLFSAFCPRASEAAHGLHAFEHLSTELGLIVALLRGASVERRRGVNVLLHGRSGAGKTELAGSVARELGASLYRVPDEDASGVALDGAKRIGALGTMQQLLAEDAAALVLFDEIEDAFPWVMESGWLRQGSGTNKARTNRLLEDNPVPAIWVGNEVEQLDPAFVRRFSLVVEVAAPPRRVREGMLALYSSGVALPLEVQRRLADNDQLMPADLARAATVTQLVRRGTAHGSGAPRMADAEVFERALRGGRARGRPPAPSGKLGYAPELVNTTVPLARLVHGLGRHPEASVCLYGPPGTGKTEFARQLARALDRPLLHRSAGDLLDMFVGGTEHAIAEMFAEASRSDCVLLLDEAEGMLRDRAHAVRGFEVTQVNELLVRMESFRGIFVCATNCFEALDPAALRRFVLRVEFKPLSTEQNLELFARTARELGLGLDRADVCEAERRLARLTALTPGDYAAVLRGRALLGAADAAALLADLERAHAEKRCARQLGFVRQAIERPGVERAPVAGR